MIDRYLDRYIDTLAPYGVSMDEESLRSQAIVPFQGWVLFEVIIDIRQRIAVGGSKVGALISICDLL